MPRRRIHDDYSEEWMDADEIAWEPPPEYFNIDEYEPHEVQKLIHESRAKRRIVTSANRWGKSVLGMAEILWCARGLHPLKTVPPVHQLWITVPDHKTFDRVHRPIFEQLCPRDWMRPGPHDAPGRFNKGDHYVDISWDQSHGPGYCRVWVLTYKQDPTSWVGAKVQGAWMDEPPPRSHMSELFARLRDSGGWLLTTFTPVDGIGWWYEAIWKPAKRGENGWYFQQAALAERDEANENPREFEVGRVLVPHWRAPFQGVDDEGHQCTCKSLREWGSCYACRRRVIEFASDYPEIGDRLIRIFGEVVGKEGLVYKQFDREIHLIPRFPITPEFELICGVDPGYHGFHVTIMAISPEERVYVVQEMFSQRQETQTRFERLANKMLDLRPKQEDWPRGIAEVPVVVDTEDPQVILELNIEAQEYLEEQAHESQYDADIVLVEFSFAPIDQGLKARKAGFLKIQQMLLPNPDRKTPPVVKRERPDLGEPEIYFLDDLYEEWQGPDRQETTSRIVWEIEAYTWLEPTRNSVVKRDDADENSAHGAHAMASFRYAVMSRFGNTTVTETEKHAGRHSALPASDRRMHRAVQKQLRKITQRSYEEDMIGYWPDDEYGDYEEAMEWEDY